MPEDTRSITYASLMLATTIHESNTTPHHQAGQQRNHPKPIGPTPPHTPAPPTGRLGAMHSGRGPVVSKPNSVSDDFLASRHFPTDPHVCHVHQTPTHYRCEAIQRIVQITELPQSWAGLNLVVLLRKEVIQPHLPVRLPCYDFVPIADPTFDGSLPRGVRPPASGVTDFHDVTGGVYKAGNVFTVTF